MKANMERDLKDPGYVRVILVVSQRHGAANPAVPKRKLQRLAMRWGVSGSVQKTSQSGHGGQCTIVLQGWQHLIDRFKAGAQQVSTNNHVHAPAVSMEVTVAAATAHSDVLYSCLSCCSTTIWCRSLCTNPCRATGARSSWFTARRLMPRTAPRREIRRTPPSECRSRDTDPDPDRTLTSWARAARSTPARPRPARMHSRVLLTSSHTAPSITAQAQQPPHLLLMPSSAAPFLACVFLSIAIAPPLSRTPARLTRSSTIDLSTIQRPCCL